MPDVIDALIKLIETDQDKLEHRNSYNISSMSITPEKIVTPIQNIIPQFKINYNVNQDIQKIAESWPDSIDVTYSKEEWGFNPQFNLDKMTEDMIDHIGNKLSN